MSEKLESSRIPSPLSGPAKRNQEAFNQQKEETISTLMRAYEDGELTLEEYDERLVLAMDANKQQELDVLTIEFKEKLAVVEKPNEPSEEVGSETTELANPVPRTTVLAAPTNSQTAIFGLVKKEGPWILSPHMESKAVFGAVQLDFREAEWVEPHAVLECKAIFGSIVIIVPSGVSVDCKGVGILGRFANRNNTKATNANYRLTISGTAVFGSIEILFEDQDSEESEEEYYIKRAQRLSVKEEESDEESDKESDEESDEESNSYD